MSRVGGDVGVDIRPFGPQDEPAVMDLLRATLTRSPAGERTAEFFRWKHADSPFGPSFMLVAESGGRVVGLRAFMRWRLAAGGRMLAAVRAVDTATHPDFQGRGIFTRLTLAALDALRGEADLVFNTPNGISLPGYLQMGWRVAGRVPVAVRVRRPLRFAAGLRSFRNGGAGAAARPEAGAPPAADVLADTGLVARILGGASPQDGRLATPRDASYLAWRYGRAPLLHYRAVGGEEGLAIFRLRARGRLWEAAVAELLVPDGDAAAARRLLARVVRAAPVDHLTASFPAGSTASRAAARAGFLPAPAGLTLAVKPLRDGLPRDPADAGSWGLCLGDVEVF